VYYASALLFSLPIYLFSPDAFIYHDVPCVVQFFVLLVLVCSELAHLCDEDVVGTNHSRALPLPSIRPFDINTADIRLAVRWLCATHEQCFSPFVSSARVRLLPTHLHVTLLTFLSASPDCDIAKNCSSLGACV